MNKCSCGSGKFPQAINDAKGIFVCFACDDCRQRKLAGFRQEIFTDPNYWTDEPIDED